MINEFTAHLARCHASVNALLSIHQRGQEALCIVLEDAYALLLAARQNPDVFIEVAHTEYGVKVTGAAADPIALLSIKIPFHHMPKDFDWRRQANTWVMAVLRLESLNVPVEHAARYLQDTGIVNCATAYRKAANRNDEGRKLAELRRTESYVACLPKIGSTTKFFDGEQVTTINTAKDQETLRALAQQPGRVLLLGEIDDQFNLKVVGVVERDATEIARFLARKARVATLAGDSIKSVSCVLSATNDNDKLTDNTITEEAV